MSDLPEFVVQPPLRCYYRHRDPSRGVCAAPATRERTAAGDETGGYFCELHARDGDAPIVAAPIIRRVGVQVEVLFAGTSLDRASAHAEAIRTLELAVEAVGGVLSLNVVTSAVGRCLPRGCPRRTRPVGFEG